MKVLSGNVHQTQFDTIVLPTEIMDDFKDQAHFHLKEMWPSMYKDFRHYCKTRNPKLGDVWTWRGAGSKTYIHLLVSQNNRPASVHDYHSAFKQLKTELMTLNADQFALNLNDEKHLLLKLETVSELLQNSMEELTEKIEIYQ